MDQENRINQREHKSEYLHIHYWVRKTLGRADHCSKDAQHKSNRFEWANVSGQYLKDMTDWMQLCTSCHRLYDGFSVEFRRSKAELLRGQTYHARPVSCLDLGISWSSTKLAADDLGTTKKNINNALRGRAKTAIGYQWKYAGV